MDEEMGQALEVLFAALFNHLWQSTLFAAAMAGLALLLRRNSARSRHLLWLAASLKFLVPFALVAALGALIPRHAHVHVDEPGTLVPAMLDLAGNFTAPLGGDVPYPQPERQAAGMSPLDWALLAMAVVWMAGALVVALRWLSRWIAIARALWSSARQAGIDFPARVRTTSRQFEPGIVGIIRPVLLLPAGIEERLTPEQMHAVLAHERCHLRWRDNFTAWLHMWVETLFWFLPPVWWIGARMIEERECACDEQVAREGHSPASYAEALLVVCEHYVASRLPCVPGVNGADLRMRIERILNNTLALQLGWPKKLVLGSMVCSAVAAPLAAGAHSGSWANMLFASAYTAGQVEYMQADSALLRNLNDARATDPLHLTCPAPGQEFNDRRRQLAATVAKLSPADGEKVLLFAVASNSTRDVRRLLAGGAKHGGDGLLQADSLMHIAAQFADLPMLELLAGAGFSIDERGTGGIGNFGGTPLMTAISMGRLDNAAWLIRHGADVSAVDRNGSSALVIAMSSCSDQALVTRLVDAGAVPNDKARRIARSMGMSLDGAPATIVPNGMPILAAQPVRLPGDGQVVVIPLPSDQPLWAPQSFGALPPPLDEQELQRSWVRPNPVDLAADAWRAVSPTRYVELTADFDGDGKDDHAQLRVDPAGWKEVLLLQLSSVQPDRWQPLFSVSHEQQSSRLVMGASLVRPGTYTTACGKGSGKCRPGEARDVTLKYPGIRYFQYEGGSSYVFWDEAQHQLQLAWISD